LPLHTLSHFSPLTHVPGIRVNDAPRELGAQGGEGGVVGHVAGGEHQGSLFLVQVSKLSLKGLMKGSVSSNVPGSTCASSKVVKGVPARKKERKKRKKNTTRGRLNVSQSSI